MDLKLELLQHSKQFMSFFENNNHLNKGKHTSTTKRLFKELYLYMLNGYKYLQKVKKIHDFFKSTFKEIKSVQDIRVSEKFGLDSIPKEVVEHLKQYNKHPLFSEEGDFNGHSSHFCIEAIKNGKMNLISGEMVGVKTTKKKTILLEDLMEENFLDLSPNCIGIYLPADEILKRTKYQWFATLPSNNILDSRIIIAKYLKASIVDAQDEYHKDNKPRTVVSI